MNALKSLFVVYPPSNTTFPPPGPPVWDLSFRGLSVQAYLHADETLKLYIAHLGAPTFSLTFPPPQLSRTFLILPGGDLVLEFSKHHEVSLTSLSQTHTPGQDVELNRIMNLLDTLPSETQVQGAKDDHRFWFTMQAGRVEDEGVVAIAIFKQPSLH